MTEFLPDGAAEWRSSFWSKRVWHAKAGHPPGDEGGCTVRGGDFVRGITSIHLVVLSMMVNRYLKPPDGGSRPTKSTCTWLNLCAGIGMLCSRTRTCLVILEHWHSKQSLMYTAKSLRMPHHTYQAKIKFFVERVPRCARLSTLGSTCARIQAGTNTQNVPVEMSPRSCRSPSALEITWSAVLPHRRWVSRQRIWHKAIILTQKVGLRYARIPCGFFDKL